MEEIDAFENLGGLDEAQYELIRDRLDVLLSQLISFDSPHYAEVSDLSWGDDGWVTELVLIRKGVDVKPEDITLDDVLEACRSVSEIRGYQEAGRS